MVTAPSTPSSALTATGESTVTPTAPSVTDAVSLGTNRSPNGVPLSVMVSGCGGALGALLQALMPNTTTGTNSTAANNVDFRRGRVTELTCHMLCSTSHSDSTGTIDYSPVSLRATWESGATMLCASPASKVGFHLRGEACYRLSRAPLAQLVEQLTLNQRVRGSKP